MPRHPGLFLSPLDGFGSAVPSFRLHQVFGAVSNRVPPGDTLSRFVGFGDKSRDNSKNYFRTQGFEFLFLSQRARRDAFGGSIAPKTKGKERRAVPIIQVATEEDKEAP